MSIPRISSVLENDYSLPKKHEETWSEYPKRKLRELKDWITDPKTQQAISNTAAILDGSEVRTGDEEAKYQKAINETDPEIKDKTVNISSAIAAIPGMTALAAAPAGAAIMKMVGLLGTGKAIYDYNTAYNNEDRHDAVVDGVLSASLVKPVSKDKLMQAEWIRKLYNIPDTFKNFKTHVPFTIGRPKATPNMAGTIYAASQQAVESGQFSYTPADLNKEQLAKIMPDIQAGIDAASEWIKSPAIKSARLHNENLARRMGFKKDHTPILFVPREKPINIDLADGIQIKGNNKNKIAGFFSADGDYFTKNKLNGNDYIVVDVNQNNRQLRHTVFHETNHNFGYGGSNGVLDDAGSKFYKTKLSYALKNKSQLSPEQINDYNYVMDIHNGLNEAVVNYAEIGKSLGLTPGQSRPSKEDVLKLLEIAKQVNPRQAFLIDLLNKDKWYRAWDLLTGVYNQGGKIKRQP